MLARAFEPFFTTKAVGAGSGLGLPMVYGFVMQSNGHVALASEPGGGTTIRMYLPQASVRRESGEAKNPQGFDKSFKGMGESILLVEDDLRVRRMTAARLRDMGYRVIEAGDGPGALAALDEHPEVQLLFTDMVMPGGMTGADLATAARAGRPQLKVLLTSGYAEPELVKRQRTNRAGWLKKPYTAVELGRTLRRIFERRVELRPKASRIRPVLGPASRRRRHRALPLQEFTDKQRRRVKHVRLDVSVALQHADHSLDVAIRSVGCGLRQLVERCQNDPVFRGHGRQFLLQAYGQIDEVHSIGDEISGSKFPQCAKRAKGPFLIALELRTQKIRHALRRDAYAATSADGLRKFTVKLLVLEFQGSWNAEHGQVPFSANSFCRNCTTQYMTEKGYRLPDPPALRKIKHRFLGGSRSFRRPLRMEFISEDA